MDILTIKDIEHIAGGGYWVQLPDGSYIYVENDEEEEDYIVFG